jgi:biopolymer transport protein ExbB
LEAGLGVLATIGNTAPFIGLFGTVIGIMSALKGISRTGSAGLDVVAGPIGEALIATAAGIACAVPAVVGYNTFVRRIRVFSNTMETFAYDLVSRISAEHAAGEGYKPSEQRPSRA